jgi:apolipoprotein N-acyltransferase
MNVAGSTWLPLVVRTFGELPWAVCGLISLVFCLWNAGRSALFAWLATRAERNGWPRDVAVVLAFAGTEVAYPQLFPFFAAGQVHAAPLLLQLAEIGGAVFVGVPLVTTALAVAEVIEARLDARPVARGRVKRLLVGPALMLLFGAVRMPMVARDVAAAPAARVGLVQGNTPHEGAPLRESLAVHRAATARLVASEKVDLVVWPESALSGVVAPERLEALFQEMAHDPHAPAPLTVPILAGAYVGQGDDVSNSAVLFAGDRVRGRYDKMHPLAFGEYIPLGDWFPAVYRLFPNAGRLTPGTSEEPLLLGSHRITPLICYEDILPAPADHAIAHAEPDLLVNLTNDAWFGNTAVPQIHLALAKLRAVEHRRYLVHATNSGVSAFVDPLGRSTGETPVLEAAAEAETIHWMRSRTLYERIGDWPWWGAAVIAAAWAIFPRRRAPSASARASAC